MDPLGLLLELLALGVLVEVVVFDFVLLILFAEYQSILIPPFSGNKKHPFRCFYQLFYWIN